jgi:hypothetical protein
LKSPRGFYAETILQEGKGFYEDIIARDKRMVCPEKISPHLLRLLMVGIISVEQRIESGCVDEDSHLRNASARYSSCFLETSLFPELNLPTISIALLRLSSGSAAVPDLIMTSIARRTSSAPDTCWDAAIFFDSLYLFFRQLYLCSYHDRPL